MEPLLICLLLLYNVWLVNLYPIGKTAKKQCGNKRKAANEAARNNGWDCRQKPVQNGSENATSDHYGATSCQTR